MTIEQKVSEIKQKWMQKPDSDIDALITEAIHYGIKLNNERIREVIENNEPPKQRIWGEEFEQGWEQGKQDSLAVLSLLDKGANV